MQTTLTREEAEAAAGKFFDSATASEQHAHYERLRNLAPYRGPKAERQRADSLRTFRENTKEAAALFQRTAEVVMMLGEVPEFLSFEWDALEARSSMSEAAE